MIASLLPCLLFVVAVLSLLFWCFSVDLLLSYLPCCLACCSAGNACLLTLLQRLYRHYYVAIWLFVLSICFACFHFLCWFVLLFLFFVCVCSAEFSCCFACLCLSACYWLVGLAAVWCQLSVCPACLLLSCYFSLLLCACYILPSLLMGFITCYCLLYYLLHLFAAFVMFAIGVPPMPAVSSAIANVRLISSLPSVSSTVIPGPSSSTSATSFTSSAAALTSTPISYGFRLSSSFQPVPVKLTAKIRSLQFVDMRELLPDKVGLLKNVEEFDSKLGAAPFSAATRSKLHKVHSLGLLFYIVRSHSGRGLPWFSSTAPSLYGSDHSGGSAQWRSWLEVLWRHL